MIARMERLEIICLRCVLEELIAFLQEQGMLHIEEVPLVVENVPSFLHRAHLTEDQRTEVEVLEELHRMLRETAPLLSAAPRREQIAEAAKSLEEEGRGAWPRKARLWSRKLRSLTRRRLNIQDNIEVLTNYQQLLGAVQPLVASRTVVLGRNARALVLKGDVSKAVERLDNRLQHELGPDCSFIQRRLARNHLVGLVTYPEERNELAGQILKQEGITPIEIPDKTLRGATFGEILDRIESTISSQHVKLAGLDEEVKRFSTETGAELKAMELTVTDRLAQLNIVHNFAQSRMLGVIHGWIPRDELPRLEEALHERFPGKTLVGALPQSEIDRKRIPTLLRNSPLVEPFEVLLALLRPPAYGSFDPTSLVAISFILFYGFILGDVVYGLAVIAVASWLRKKWGYNEIVKSAGTVGVYMGASSIVFGVLFGEYCGDLAHRLFGIQPLWFHRGHEVMQLLWWGIAFGVVQVPLGLIIGIREDLLHNNKNQAMEKLGVLLGLTAVGLFVLGLLTPVDILFVGALGVVVLIAGMGLLFKTLGALAAVQILEVVTLVGNVLSYARLMALGIASVTLADVANLLGSQAGNLLIGIPIALTLHLLNIGIGMFSSTIHSLRLNYVEFLPKFHRPEGRNYEPFKKEAAW